MKLIIPEGYKTKLDLKQTEKAIKLVKDTFEMALSTDLQLRRVSAPLFVLRGTGINDDLNGVERPVSFPVKDMKDSVAEVVQSLAKWKRMMLADYDIQTNYGIYADMNALRPDEELDNLHSIYVDQWDWELSIPSEQRNLQYLKSIVNRIYKAIKRTEFTIYEYYPQIEPELPEEIYFVHSEELEKMYPDLKPKERENKIAEKYGAVFIIGIGNVLSNGQPHDGRAPDYDDWSTENENGFHGLNGDIIVWNNVLKMAFELSSMGIRVDAEALKKQLKIRKCEDRSQLLFHRRLLGEELPDAIGGGIGQSRLCMFLLKKAHVGEIQSSIWPGEMVDHCKKCGITLI